MNPNSAPPSLYPSRDALRLSGLPEGAPFSRREALRRCVFGSAGLLLMAPFAIRAAQSAPAGQAKSVIQIWLWGGPCHLDTFDPKPEAGHDYCGPLDKPIATNVGRHQHRRAASRAGQAGRQVLAHPQHDPRQQRPRDGGLPGADRARLRARRLSQRRRGGVALQGLRRRLQGPDPALHRADPAAGPLLRGRLPGPALQALRHRRRPGGQALSRWRASSPRASSDERQKDRRELLAQTEHAGRRAARERHAQDRRPDARSRPTT